MKPDFLSMPKLDLHCHLDGSLSHHFLQTTAGDAAYAQAHIQAPADCPSLSQYLTCFDLPVSCLQETETIRQSILDVVAQAATENIRYIEIRFAPLLSTQKGLSLYEVVEAALSGCQLAEKNYPVYTNLILCAMRHHAPEQNKQVAACAREFLGLGVCALDLAGDEMGHPNEEFEALFQEANRLNLPFTIHSGECGRTKNVELALAYHAKRVGHGIAAIKSPDLLDACKKAKLGFELCPTSNFQTKAVTNPSNYPLRPFLDAGLLATINTDNRTVSNTTLTDEYALAYETLQIKKEDFQTLYRNSVEISFADDSIKHQLWKLI